MSRPTKVPPQIQIDETRLGPAMLALTPPMRAFVVAIVRYGLNRTEAARAAGYSGENQNKATLQSIGSNLAHDPRIQAAIREEADKYMIAEGPSSIRTLVQIRDDKTAEHKDRIKAAIELMNRSGFHAVTENISRVEVHMTESQKDARIVALCAELGIPKQEAQKFLIAPDKAAPIIDAAYEVIPDSLSPELSEDKKQARDSKNNLRRQRRKMTPEELGVHKTKMRAEKSAAMKAQYQEHRQRQEGELAETGIHFLADKDSSNLKDIL